MNRIGFQIRPAEDGTGEEVRILIDGRDLMDLVRGMEAPQAAADGQPQLAASYVALTPDRWADLEELDDDDRIAIFGCQCGVIECWPLRVRVVLNQGTVVWSDFQQPNRDWRYHRLGPFVFQRGQYEEAIRSASRPTSR